MAGFAALAAFSIVGIVAAITWVTVVSFGIRRAERRAMLNLGTHITEHGRVARIARQSTGVHWT
jgi:hypothetical protein